MSYSHAYIHTYNILASQLGLRQEEEEEVEKEEKEEEEQCEYVLWKTRQKKKKHMCFQVFWREWKRKMVFEGERRCAL